jgi:hypothetical protein
MGNRIGLDGKGWDGIGWDGIGWDFIDVARFRFGISQTLAVFESEYRYLIITTSNYEYITAHEYNTRQMPGSFMFLIFGP